MRLFIAIELPKSVKNELNELQKQLKQYSSGGNFVPKENMHITMHFLGEVGNMEMASAAKAMREAVRGIRPFMLHLNEYDCFDKRSGKTSVVTIKGDLKELDNLHEALEFALADEGFGKDMKRFVPHITLGRNVVHDDISTGELKQIKLNGSLQVKKLILFESERINGKMVYTPIHTEEL